MPDEINAAVFIIADNKFEISDIFLAIFNEETLSAMAYCVEVILVGRLL